MLNGRKLHAVRAHVLGPLPVQVRSLLHGCALSCVLLQAAAFSLAQTPAASATQLADLDRAAALSQNGAQAQAERIVIDYLVHHPDSARAHALLGLVKYRQGIPDKSLDQYSLAAKFASLKADDLRIVALDYLQLHDLPASEHWLKESIVRSPNDWRTWRYLAGVQYSEEHPVDSARSFEQCLRLDPTNALAEDGLARSHEALGITQNAEQEYRQAVLLNSRAASPSWLPLLHYGSYLRRTSRVSESLPLLNQAAQLSPDDWEAHAELAQAYEDQGDLKTAESEYQRAIAQAPDRVRLHIMLARTYQRGGQKDKASTEIKLYQSFAAQYSGNRDLLDK